MADSGEEEFRSRTDKTVSDYTKKGAVADADENLHKVRQSNYIYSVKAR